MTPRERAERLKKQFHTPTGWSHEFDAADITAVIQEAVAAERVRILKKLKAESDKWFSVGESHPDAGVREAAMGECAGWNKAIDLIDSEDF